MSASTTAAPTHLLTQVAGDRQTGALVVGGHPGGAVYVLEGRVIYAESPAAPGVGELLTSSGRLANRTWQNALDLGTSTARVGRLLVDQGHLTRGELELCVLGATYDAAYFALAPKAAPTEFLDGATHWLGPIVHIDPAAVQREVGHRTRLLDEIFPDPRVDTAAVTPVARPPRERVTLTALQWELLIHADGQRTPADLALLLGKAGYATIQELRRLAAMGLLDLPHVRADAREFVRLPRTRGAAADVHRPTVRPADAPSVPVVSGERPAIPDPSRQSRPSPSQSRQSAAQSRQSATESRASSAQSRPSPAQSVRSPASGPTSAQPGQTSPPSLRSPVSGPTSARSGQISPPSLGSPVSGPTSAQPRQTSTQSLHSPAGPGQTSAQPRQTSTQSLHSPAGSGQTSRQPSDGAGECPAGPRLSPAGTSLSPAGAGRVPAGAGPAPADSRQSPAGDTGTNGTVYRPPRLARRKPGAKLPKEVAGETPPVHPGTDEVLLKRIRTALRALR